MGKGPWSCLGLSGYQEARGRLLGATSHREWSPSQVGIHRGCGATAGAEGEELKEGVLGLV